MTQTGTKPSIPEDSPELSAQEEQLLAELDDWGRELVETARKRNPSISIAEAIEELKAIGGIKSAPGRAAVATMSAASGS